MSSYIFTALIKEDAYNLKDVLMERQGTGWEAVSHFSPLVFGGAQSRPTSPRMPHSWGSGVSTGSISKPKQTCWVKNEKSRNPWRKSFSLKKEQGNAWRGGAEGLCVISAAVLGWAGVTSRAKGAGDNQQRWLSSRGSAPTWAVRNPWSQLPLPETTHTSPLEPQKGPRVSALWCVSGHLW